VSAGFARGMNYHYVGGEIRTAGVR
jgi:hypothetical protein